MRKAKEALATMALTGILILILVITLKITTTRPYSEWIGCDTGDPVYVTYYPEKVIEITETEVTVLHKDGQYYTAYVNGTDAQVGDTIWVGYADGRIMDLQ